MTWWKKLLIYLSVIIGASLIIFYVFYYIVTHYEIPSIPAGQYNLTKITKASGSEEITLEEYAGGEYYISVNENFEIISHSQNKGIAENEIGYEYLLHSNELVIFLPTDDADIAYTGYYFKDSNQIKISYTVGEAVHNFYYGYVETSE